MLFVVVYLYQKVFFNINHVGTVSSSRLPYDYITGSIRYTTAGLRKICFSTGRQKSHLLLSTMICILLVLIYLVRFPTKSKRWDFCWPVPMYYIYVILIYKVGFLPAGAETHFPRPSCREHRGANRVPQINKVFTVLVLQ